MIDPGARDSGVQPASPKPRLLLAEDHFSACVYLCELLEPDYEVSIAANGEQAWSVARRERFDALLADVFLPVVDGVTLTRRLRAEVDTAQLPIILLTANGDQETLRRIAESGADGFLLKPFRPSELLECVRARLAR